MNNICVLRHSKIVMFWLIIIEYFFSVLYTHARYVQKENKYAKKNKSKKNQNAFKYSCKRVSRRCGSYKMYLEGDSPHQLVMIVCECFDFLLSQIVIIWDTYALLLCFHTQHVNSLLLLIHVQVQCDFAITGINVFIYAH